MKTRLTRRQLAGALASAASLAQAPQPPAQTPDDLLRAARDRNRANGEELAKLEVPMPTEPAFQFKA